MGYTLFISAQRLKKITQIHENVEPDDLTPFATQAQDIYIQDILGTTFYTSLKDKVVAGTLTDEEKLLINEYIAPTLANYCLYLALPSLNYKVRNKSVLSPSSEESVNTTLDELKYLRDATKDTSEFYAQRLIDYLCNNDSDYPLYVNAKSEDGMLPNKNSQYFSGLYIPSLEGTGTCGNCDDTCTCNVRYL